MRTASDNITLDDRYLWATKFTIIHLPKYGLDFIGGGLLLPYTDAQFSPSSTDRTLYLYLRWWVGFPLS